MILDWARTIGLRVGWFPILMGTILLILGLMPLPWQSALYFTPENFQSGQWWLLLSCQLVHLNVMHTLSNIAGLLILCSVVLDKQDSLQLLTCTVSCLISIGTLLLVFPDLYSYYAGFSGVMYGLFFLGGLKYWHKDKVLAAFIIAVLSVKVLWDIAGPSAFERVDWLGARIAVEVHLAGIVGAVLYYLSSWFYRANSH